MIPGKATVVTCPYCGTKKELMTLGSGNTFGAVRWSDGRVFAPMLPKASFVQKCPKCGKFYLYYKRKCEEGENTSSELGELSYREWNDAYFQFVEENAQLDKSDWEIVRMGLIRAYNDSITGRRSMRPAGFLGTRLEQFLEPLKDDAEFLFIASVIEDYIRDFDGVSAEDTIFKAELYREAGQFDKCEATLALVKRADFSVNERDYYWELYEDIKQRAAQRDTVAFRVMSASEKSEEKEKIRKLKEKMDAESAKREWIEEQEKDPRLKVCKAGHCFSHQEHRCEWCCGEKVVDRVENGAYGKVVKLYVGQRDGQWVLTINPRVKGKPDNFRSITVELVGGYRCNYRIEGDNPNPWCHYAIKLGGDTIIGRDLTKKCDQLIAEDLEEIPFGIPVSQPVVEYVDKGDCSNNVEDRIKRNKKLIVIFAVLSVFLFCIGMPFLFIDMPEVGVIALVGFYLGGMAILLFKKNKELQNRPMGHFAG